MKKDYLAVFCPHGVYYNFLSKHHARSIDIFVNLITAIDGDRAGICSASVASGTCVG